MHKLRVALVMACLSPRLIASGIPTDQVVGYLGGELKRGNNRVEINFDAVDSLFSTLDMVFKMEPPDGMIGDEISFPLDGKMRRYRFDFYDGTNSILTEVGGQHTTSLDAIPWMPVVWIDHKSDKRVSILQSGVVDGKYARMLDPPEAARRLSTPIKVTLVDKDDPNKHIPIRLKGGHISLEK